MSEEDIASLNRQAVERAAVMARWFGTAMVVVGALLAATWLWTAVRAQLRTGLFGGFGEAERGLSLVDRVDFFAQSLSTLGFAGLTAGLGLVLRLAGDYAQTRVGGSVTGYRVGDVFEFDDDGRDSDGDETQWQPERPAMQPPAAVDP